MRVAVPLFKNRISPHFCTSGEVLLVDVESKKIVDKRRTYWEELNPSEKIGKLKQWGVNTLLCGGITAFNKNQLQSLGIGVVSELRGQVEEVLEQWLRHANQENQLNRGQAGPMSQGHVNFRKGGA